MRELIEMQQQLVPELLDVMKKRYRILHQVMLSDLIGRRTLATALGMTERMLRTETDFLKDQGMLDIHSAGMRISESGRLLLEKLEPLYKTMFGLSDLEEKIKEGFGLSKVIIVAGDSDTSALTKRELGRAGGQALRQVLRPHDVVAVTGGTTIAQLASQLSSSTPLKDNWFVPARGGLGESMEYQASTIASTMHQAAGESLLHC